MGREIKFRAWHSKLNKMFSPEEMSADQLTLDTNGRGFVNVSGQNTSMSTFAGERMIPMQFTGRKDKNGNEIYEGDILHDGVKCLFWTVEYDAREARFVMIPTVPGYSQRFEAGIECHLAGNRYEHPELLKQEGS